MAEQAVRLKPAAIAAGAGLGFAIFVALVPGLNTNPFMQGVTGLVLVTAIAVILFSAVPSHALVRVPVALGGAAAFFYYALTPVEHYIFPRQTITGTVYYTDGATPAVSVAIRDPDTKQEVLTDARGDFTLPNVTWSVAQLLATTGGRDYPLVLNETRKYPIIPRPPQVVATPQTRIDQSKWQRLPRNNCPAAAGAAGDDQVLFSLKDSLPVAGGYPKMYVQISTPPGVRISHAEKLDPPPGTGSEIFDNQRQSPEPTEQTHKWWIPVSDTTASIEFSVCVYLKGGAGDFNGPNASYWFERLEVPK